MRKMTTGLGLRSWIRGFERADRAIPGWLPETVPGTGWGPGTGLLLIAGLVAGIQAVVPAGREVSPALATVAALYALSLVAALLVRLSPDRRLVLLGSGLALLLAGALEATSAGILGILTLDILAVVLAYHLPARWSLPLLGAVIAVVAATYARGRGPALVLPHMHDGRPPLPLTPVILVALVAVALTLRSRSVTIVRLQEAQGRLQAEMERTARLAAGRERTRIARDMHDVLAHSLTMVSMQTHAIRQVIAHDPAQAARLLDELAAVVRECIVESRHVVGTLRAAAEVAGESLVVENLRAVADRFAQRTGMRCVVDEQGVARTLDDDQEETLRYALQEALTNAFRHGAARHLRAELVWQPSAVTLTMCDDGAAPVPALSALAAPDARAVPAGGHGLHGMRERATALGGSMRAGPREEGGFAVTLTLPLLTGTVCPGEET